MAARQQSIPTGAAGYLVETLRQEVRLGGQALHVQPLLQHVLRLGCRGLPVLPAQRCSPPGCRKRLGVSLPLCKGGIDVGSLCTGDLGVKADPSRQRERTQSCCTKLSHFLPG